MSATVRDRPVLSGPAGGGVPARRAVARWAWRLFRREWRQQILVLALLILTVAAAAFSVSAAYNVASLPGPQFGSANHLLQFDGSDPRVLAADIAAARKAFGTIQVIGRRFVPIPGSAQTVEFRAEDPHGPFSGPMIALTQGRYPSGAGQAAVTGQIAQTLQLRIGSRLSLGGHHQTVTGIVENPSDLSDQFVLVSALGRRPATVGDGAAERQPRQFRRLPRRIPRPAGMAGAGRQHPGSSRRRRARCCHGPAASDLPGSSRRLRRYRRAPPAPARHARRDRGDAQAASDGHGCRRSRRGRHRRRCRDRRRAGGVDCGRAGPGGVRRAPDRPARYPVGPGRAGHAARRRDGDCRGVVASAGRRPATGHARPVGPAAAAQARTSPGHARRPDDRGRRGLPGPGRPDPPSADHRRRAGDHPGDPAHQPAGHPGTRRAGRPRAGRGAAGAAGPGPSTGPDRGGPGRDQPRPRDQRGDHHQLGRRQDRRQCGQPAGHPDPGLDRPGRGRKWPGWPGRPGQDARPARRPGRSRAPDRRTAASPRSYRPRHARQPRRQAAGRRPGQPDRTAGSQPGRTAEPGRRRPGRDLQHDPPVCRHPSRAPLPRDQLRQRSPHPPTSSPPGRGSSWSPHPPPLRPSPTCSGSGPRPTHPSQPRS